MLRSPDGGDVAAIVDGVGDWDVARHLARVPHPYSPADVTFFLEHVVPTEWVWAITMHGSDELLGTIGLTPQNGAEAAELGFWLARHCWGRGIVTEAASAVVTFGLNKLHLPLITAGYFEENLASGRVLAKLGFSETGRTLRPCLAVGGEVASVEMSLLANLPP